MTINLEKSLDIEAPIADVYAVWENLESNPGVLPNGLGAHLELTEKVDGERLSWRVTGQDVASTASLQLRPAGEDGASTKMTLIAHYPNGLGHGGTIAQVAAQMETGLANIARLLRGEKPVDVEQSSNEALSASVYPEVTASAAMLQQSWSAATEAWVNSLNNTFQVFSALAWLPFQGGRALQPGQRSST